MRVSELKKKKVGEKTLTKKEVTEFRFPNGTVTITKEADRSETAAKEKGKTVGTRHCPKCKRFLSRDGVCKKCGKVGVIERKITRNVDEAKERRAKEMYFAKRNAFYKELRSIVKEHEAFQKDLKKKIRYAKHPKSLADKQNHKYMVQMLTENTKTLTLLYLTISYVRFGEKISEEAERRGYSLGDLEVFINRFFRKKPVFRKLYWDIWKKKFAK